MSSNAMAARMMLRPILPNPLIPTLIAISPTPLGTPTPYPNKAGGPAESLVPWTADACIILGGALLLHAGHPGPGGRAVALVRVPGDPVPQVHRQPRSEDGVPAGQLQSRRRRVDLDSRRVGGRGADRAGAR